MQDGEISCKNKDVGSWDSAVSIVTGHGLDGQGVGFQVPIGSRIFSTSSTPALGLMQPPIQWVLLGTRFPAMVVLYRTHM
jgi:hypothetical protein